MNDPVFLFDLAYVAVLAVGGAVIYYGSKLVDRWRSR